MGKDLNLISIIFGAIVTGIVINNTRFYYKLYGVQNNIISQTEIIIMFWLNLILSVIFLWAIISVIFIY
jgi:hypothetical protein